MNLARKAVRLFPRGDAPRHLTNHLRREWMRKTFMLGHKHILRGGIVKWGNRGDLAVLVACVCSAFPWEIL